MEISTRKPNASFVGSEKDSPTKKLGSPSDTFGSSKKGFLLNLFTKKKAGHGQDPEHQPSRPNEGDNNARGRSRQKFINRKNIADGRIRLNIFDNDRVPEDFLIEYKDNPFDLLDMNPVRTTSYIENLRNRDFSLVDNREVKRFIESHQQENEIAPPLGIENLEYELIELQGSYERFLGKFFSFFQGLLAGFCVIHLFLIFAGSDDQVILESYVLSALRINQIFYVVALISALGAFQRFIETRARYTELKIQPMLKEDLSKRATKYAVAAICFLIVYGILVFNHEFVALLSDKANAVDQGDFDTTFSIFRILSVIMAVLSIIGWFILVLAFEQGAKHKIDRSNYSDLTGDGSYEEENI